MSITSVNAVFTLTIPAVFSSGQQLQQFATEELFDTDALESSEIMMGADGILTAGFVNQPVVQTITLMADSVSGNMFDQWQAYQKTNQTVAAAIGNIVLPDMSLVYAMPKGFLRSYQPIPSAQKTLKPRKFVIVWQSMSISPTPSPGA